MRVDRGTWGRVVVAGGLLIGAADSGGCETNASLRRDGMRAYETGDTANAAPRFEKAATADPTDWRAQYYLGLVHLREGRPLDAQLAFEKAVAIRRQNPRTPDILDALAEAIFRQNQPEKLAAMLQRAVDDTGTSRDYLRQARYLGRAGDVDAARVAYRKAANVAPAGDPGVYIEMADFLEANRDTEGAVAAIRHAYYLAPARTDLADRLRRYGLVPGPTVALPPETR